MANKQTKRNALSQKLFNTSDSEMDVIKIRQLSGKTFTIKLDSKWFSKDDVLNISGIVCKVVKVRKFTWWRKLLFRLGFKHYSMDLKQIK